MGCSCSNGVANADRVSKQLHKELTKISDNEGIVRVAGRFHQLPERLEDHYTVTEDVLGHGQSGEVRLATSKETGRRFAVKTLNMCNLPSKLKKRLVNEIGILLVVDHPGIATLADAYESEEQIRLVTECMDGGNLCQLAKTQKFTEKVAAEMVKQMLAAVNYLHFRNIIHRDIKLDNFLVESVDGSYLKLIDFGVSKYIAQNQILGTTNSTGTLAYTAPEVLNNWYDNKCDIWSLGVITFVLLVGYMPFYGDQKSTAGMIQQSRPLENGPKERWNNISEEAKDLVHKMFTRSPIDRISAENALKHPWITGACTTADPTASLEFATVGLQQFAKASQFRRACMLMTTWSIPSEEQIRIREAFVHLDQENKGIIDIGALISKLGLSEKEAVEIQRALGKRYGKELRYSDFMAAMACSRVADHTELVAEVFRRFDISHSGSLTEKDLKNVLGDEFDCGAVLARFPDSQISFADFVAYLGSEKLAEVHGEMSPRSPMADPISPKKQKGRALAT